MYKSIFFLSVFCMMALTPVFSQTVNDVPIKDIEVKYIEIIGDQRTMSKKMNIEIEFGQEGNLMGAQNTKIKDEEGNRVLFNSMVDALNFMDKHGYRYLDSYTTSVKKTTIYHYILVKKGEG